MHRAEDVPVPVPVPVIEQPVAKNVKLGPSPKLMAITVLTRELAESSSAEAAFKAMLRESAALALDATLFSNLAATDTRPAGMLNGVAPLTAATGGGDAAMTNDLSALAGAVAQVTSGLAYVANPAQANAIKLRRGGLFPFDVPVWPTIVVPAGTIIALDPQAFVSAFGSEPRGRP